MMISDQGNGIRSRYMARSIYGDSGRGMSYTLLMLLVSSLAWFYVGGRLWQDAETRKLLYDLLEKNSKMVPFLLPRTTTVEEQLMNLGCKDLSGKISKLEVELALARSQGYLNKQPSWNSSTNVQRYLAVIGIYTGFGGTLNRNRLRNTWLPTGKALRSLEEKGIIVRFVIGRSPNKGDSLDRKINEEAAKTNDFFILESHEEDSEELPQKAKLFFSFAAEEWDADFYVKVDDTLNLNLDELAKLLASYRHIGHVYMGCMKSGEVISEEGTQWYEPQWWKFGDEKSYFRHAASPMYVLSRELAHYININSAFLVSYAHEDISVGSWMLGLDTRYIDEKKLCCSSNGKDGVCSMG
eukprot:TRINITY_DN3394_c0_g1_i1.p1 TRINITY_DN3394_c0_g1~~TRINITY_DN3394_c0_g1_i1.p1  ORF type:complete len:354 (+),score=65.36 TRINITY_DN3394_c0_g1_i1:279-1340(+)